MSQGNPYAVPLTTEHLIPSSGRWSLSTDLHSLSWNLFSRWCYIDFRGRSIHRSEYKRARRKISSRQSGLKKRLNVDAGIVPLHSGLGWAPVSFNGKFCLDVVCYKNFKAEPDSLCRVRTSRSSGCVESHSLLLMQIVSASKTPAGFATGTHFMPSKYLKIF